MRPLDVGSYAITLPGGGAVRVTTGAETFDMSSDNHQLFAQGGEVFATMQDYAVPSEQSADTEAVAWLVKQAERGTTFVVKTESTVEQVETFGALLEALERIGRPAKFPYSEWPGVTATVVA